MDFIFSFDYAGFSVWRVNFKYNEEFTGLHVLQPNWRFFYRLKASRKYLFGSVGVLGKPLVCKITLKLLFSPWMAQVTFLPSRIAPYGRGS